MYSINEDEQSSVNSSDDFHPYNQQHYRHRILIDCDTCGVGSCPNQAALAVGRMEFFYRALQKLNRRGDGDFIDHLSATTTVTILLVSALMVSAKQYVGQPIQCWVPAQFTSAWEQYTENYCYVQNTYWIGENHAQIPEDTQKRTKAQINYYQWVPFILLGQAALFYLPRLIWRATSGLSGINFFALHTLAHECHVADAVKGEHLRRALADYVMTAIDINRGQSFTLMQKCKKVKHIHQFCQTDNAFSRHRHLCPLASFLFTKILFVINALGQLFLINATLGIGDHAAEVNSNNNNGNSFESSSLGLILLRNLINGTDWSTSGLFPRTTLCDLEVRVLGNLHRYTIQCVLMINMFNEKLFASLWLWTLMVAFVSLVALIFWLRNTCSHEKRMRFILRLLPYDDYHFYYHRNHHNHNHHDHQWHHSKNHHDHYQNVKLFVDEYLKIDGIFLLRSIDGHVGSVLASQITAIVLENYNSRKEWIDHHHQSELIDKYRSNSKFKNQNGGGGGGYCDGYQEFLVKPKAGYAVP